MPQHQIALFGAGRIGRVHAMSIAASSRACLKYVVDVNADFAKILASDFGAEATTADAALADPDISVILIGSSTDTHVDFIKMGAAAGKHVFCEKPIDLEIARVDACLDAIKTSGTKLFVAFNRRFDTHFGGLAKRVADGEIGDIELLTIISKDPESPPRAYQEVAGGMFRDMTIHDIDLARFILGEEPVKVTATAAALHDPVARSIDDIDTAVLTLQTASGKIATITNSRRATFGYDQRIEAHGSKGMLSAGNVHDDNVRIANGGGIKGAKVKHFFLERYAEAYRAELDAFLDCIENGTPPSPSGVDGRKALIIADAAYQSWREERTVTIKE